MNRSHSKGAHSVHKRNWLPGSMNFSVDLIYGSPLQTDAGCQPRPSVQPCRTAPLLVCTLANRKPSLQIQIDRKTHRQTRQAVCPIPSVDETKWPMRDTIIMRSAITHYPERNRHNSSYWKGDTYTWDCPSANSFDETRTRRWNLSNNNLYIESL